MRLVAALHRLSNESFDDVVQRHIAKLQVSRLKVERRCGNLLFVAKESGETSPFTEAQIVDWLVDECRDVAGRTTAVMISGDRIFATGGTVIALAATVAVGGGRGYLLMWLPLAVSIVILHGLYLNNTVRNLVGYQIGLEREIARWSGLPLIIWQSRIRKGERSHRQLTTLLLAAVAYAYLSQRGAVRAAARQVEEAFAGTSPGAG
ncbi:hypothetical protein ABZ345_14040 [Lentzea sp. NPDC005914]|uniref:hypothetical protein n=1 Tax=Lentzea sp. NPDC005914 TaxID=3154572 RepID=UPI0033FE9573